MSDTDRLRQAAQTLRERAGAATNGRWEAEMSNGTVSVFRPEEDDGIFEDHYASAGDAIYIATMHPTVGLGLASLLENFAAWGDEGLGRVDKNTNWHAAYSDHVNLALALADLINGTNEDQS